jgi:glycosyltransferase involved in cell wall biosynthesis
MRVRHITPSYKPAYVYGGPVYSVSRLCEELKALFADIQVLTTTANGKHELNVPAGIPQLVDGVQVIYYKRITKDHTHVSFSLWKAVWKNTGRDDIVHIHSWWNPLVMIAAWIAVKKKATVIVSPRGMLSEYSLVSQRRIKLLLQFLVGRSVFRAAHLHTTTEAEARECEKWVPASRIHTLPNILDLPAPFPRIFPDSAAVFRIGFLSRIDPKKGLDLLISAYKELAFPAELHIAGSGDEKYIQELKKGTAGGSGKVIEWAGWKGGDEKFSFLANLDVLVLPSYNENFANVVIEALSQGTAVIVSQAVGLAGFVELNDLGWVCTNEVADIRSKLTEARNDSTRRKNIRERATAIISTKFNKRKLAGEYLEMYKKVHLKDTGNGKNGQLSGNHPEV